MIGTAGVLASTTATGALAMHHEKDKNGGMHKYRVVATDALKTMLNCIDKSEHGIAHCYNVIAGV